MHKDFSGWNKEKQKIHLRDEQTLFHEREIWWCALGVNVGFEQDGTNEHFERPVLVVKKFNQDVLWVLPLTRSNKNNQYYYRLDQDEDKDSMVILSQLRLISSNRLLRKMRMISKEEFKEIIEKTKQFFP
jgi:mRNA interferase MazF